LGAIGEGDIGQHFPPSDDKFKNMDSREMLKSTRHVLIKKGARILNVDVTIICQEPKISSYKLKMKKTLATDLSIPESRVNIKATTTEKLGFLGRKEGIAAQAAASVSMSVIDN
ncbi:MAG: 2-C-methyl-D-erythritol 2,4-cyclodiphosphate synthase, partial [Rickettsiales bacterium]|nr:2-C-methyl-D-erythritol 2,4-cyclodiphosphate synthase [Rickettsiales bacterium]